MRRNRFLAVGVAVGILIAGLFVGGAAYTIEDLFGYCFSEAVPELGCSYSRVLVAHFYATFSQEELKEWALHGPTACVRFAAIEALKLHRIFINPYEELMQYTAEELRAMAVTSVDAARAYYVKIRGEVTVESLREDAGGRDLLAIAAGEVLGGYYSPGSFNPLSVDAAIELATSGESPALRLAGGIALATYILVGESDFAAEMSAQELEIAIVAATGYDLGLLHVYQMLLSQLIDETL